MHANNRDNRPSVKFELSGAWTRMAKWVRARGDAIGEWGLALRRLRAGWVSIYPSGFPVPRCCRRGWTSAAAASLCCCVSVRSVPGLFGSSSESTNRYDMYDPMAERGREDRAVCAQRQAATTTRGVSGTRSADRRSRTTGEQWSETLDRWKDAARMHTTRSSSISVRSAERAVR